MSFSWCSICQALYITPLKITGILGLPVIRALGCITMSAEGRFQIQTEEPAEEGEPNLCFDELTPMVAALLVVVSCRRSWTRAITRPLCIHHPGTRSASMKVRI